ncbi:DUF4870 family protein [Erythrobacter sp. Alg231-14]|uniref:DUF4870 family protein n=1 Tax=Erythrobacter sp. Alg231-14 TaxID=1922225 RepID=UPI00307B59DF
MTYGGNDQPPASPYSPAGGANKGLTFQRPAIVAILFLVNILVGFSVFVGLVLAYIWRGEADTEEWEKTHYTYLIKTFWIGFVASVMGMFLWFSSFFTMVAMSGDPSPPGLALFSLFFGMMFGWLVLAGWFCTRCILSLVKAGNRQPMPKPTTWWF